MNAIQIASKSEGASCFFVRENSGGKHGFIFAKDSEVSWGLSIVPVLGGSRGWSLSEEEPHDVFLKSNPLVVLSEIPSSSVVRKVNQFRKFGIDWVEVFSSEPVSLGVWRPKRRNPKIACIGSSGVLLERLLTKHVSPDCCIRV